MVIINLAYTEHINPPGASPVLSLDQIWNGLQRKIRRAQDFVPVITGCEVLEESENTVIREAHFAAVGGNPEKSIRETCKSYPKAKVDFWQPDGALITNTVSDGAGDTEHDYYMTYSFEWRHPEVSEGSEEHQKLIKEHKALAKTAVHSSIEAMRKMGSAGELN